MCFHRRLVGRADRTLATQSQPRPMSRYPTKASLPPLEDLLPEFTGFVPGVSKLQQTTELLEQVIRAHRATRNLTFYSTRVIARFFGTSQNTASLVVKKLETDGLLRRTRGSHTIMLGAEIVTRSQIRAVAGLMQWSFAQRFSETHTSLALRLGENLWPHHIALEIIPHLDIGDTRPDMSAMLKRHAIDFAIWPFPFAHHREHMLRLQDRGTRNLVIGMDADVMPMEPTIIVEIIPAYRKVLNHWRKQYGIERVVVISPREFSPRGRINTFCELAKQMGFDCEIVPNTYTLPEELLANEKHSIGIALLDEHSTAEFTFYQPHAFDQLVRRHRILLGNGSIHVPFITPGELRVDRIFVPIRQEPLEGVQIQLCEAITQTLSVWCAGDYTAPPLRVQAVFWDNGRLWRYL